jgi:hypothetical protein
MLMQEARPEMVASWKSVFNEYRERLIPNRKKAADLVAYLKDKYPLAELSDKDLKQVIIDNVLSTEFYSDKLPAGKTVNPQVFRVVNTGQAQSLYRQQDDIFKGQDIIVGIDMETGFFHIEGSSLLWDELFAFRGLDAGDLDNYYLVAEYIACLKRFNMLDDVLERDKKDRNRRNGHCQPAM